MPDFLHRILALFLSLSVQWSALGGATMVCMDMDSNATASIGSSSAPESVAAAHSEPLEHGSVGAMADMSDMIGVTSERGNDGPDCAKQDHRDRAPASSTTPSCALNAPEPGEAPHGPGSGCAFMTSCTTLSPTMIPSLAAALSEVREVQAALLVTSDVAPLALSTPPDAPPPRS